jgi:hypothetical protein
MLNSYLYISRCPLQSPWIATNLLNGHNDLYGVEAIETKIVVEVRLGVELKLFVSMRTRDVRNLMYIPLRCLGPAY